METPFPTYKEFCELFVEWRKFTNKGKMPHKVLLVTYYIFSLIGLAMFYATLSMMGGYSSSTTRRFPSSKYKKVVKEGILWDSIEWHER